MISRGAATSSTRPASFPLSASRSDSESTFTRIAAPRTAPSVPGVQALGTATIGNDTGATTATDAWS